MFNLIISIIAIALVVVLAGASLYYGGEAFNSGSTDAKSATYINQAQQIQAGATLFKANEGGTPTNVAALYANGAYLSAEPEMPTDTFVTTWELGDDAASDSVVFAQIAISATADAGVTGDICDSINADGAGVVFCESVTAPASIASITAGTEPTNDYDTDDQVVIYMAL